MKEFEITIIETIQKRAIVMAQNWEDAEEMAIHENAEFETRTLGSTSIDVEEVEYERSI